MSANADAFAPRSRRADPAKNKAFWKSDLFNERATLDVIS
jgi:hypothetical protein